MPPASGRKVRHVRGEAASPISNRSEDESPSSRPSREASTEVDTSATSEAQAAFLLREQQLLMELSESQGEVANFGLNKHVELLDFVW